MYFYVFGKKKYLFFEMMYDLKILIKIIKTVPYFKLGIG